MQRLTDPGQLPEIITFGAASHEWLLTRTSVGTVMLTRPLGYDSSLDDEMFDTMREAVEALVESIRSTADELSQHDGDRIGSGYLYAEADDVEASIEQLCDGDPLPGQREPWPPRPLQDVLDEHVAAHDRLKAAINEAAAESTNPTTKEQQQ